MRSDRIRVLEAIFLEGQQPEQWRYLFDDVELALLDDLLAKKNEAQTEDSGPGFVRELLGICVDMDVNFTRQYGGQKRRLQLALEAGRGLGLAELIVDLAASMDYYLE